jgi:hypothetical protein
MNDDHNHEFTLSNTYSALRKMINFSQNDSSSASEASQRTHEREKNSQRKHTRLSVSCRNSRKFDRSKSASSSERRAERRKKTKREHSLVNVSRATLKARIHSDVTSSSEKENHR